MADNSRFGHVLKESTKFGCALSFGITCVTAVIASLLVTLLVSDLGAWRRRPLFTEPASIIVFASAVIGFIVGFTIKFRQAGKAHRGK
jgi:hypothetical protein